MDTKYRKNKGLGRGFRSDLLTREGVMRAEANGYRYGCQGFTDEQRAKGKVTQRAQGRFGKGRFTPILK
jgi:hypothetical protein